MFLIDVETDFMYSWVDFGVGNFVQLVISPELLKEAIAVFVPPVSTAIIIYLVYHGVRE